MLSNHEWHMEMAIRRAGAACSGNRAYLTDTAAPALKAGLTALESITKVATPEDARGRIRLLIELHKSMASRMLTRPSARGRK